MRLTLKLASAIFVGVLCLVAAYSYVTVRRQITEFGRDSRAKHQVLGRTLAAAVAAAWRDGGESGAGALLASADAQQSDIHLRWVALDGSEPNYRPPFDVPADAMMALAEGRIVTVGLRSADAELYTYV